MKKSVLNAWISRITSEWKELNTNFNAPPGRAKFALFLDYIYCVFKYHISYSEYFEQYKFYELNSSEREEFITRAQAHRIEQKLNKKAVETFWFKDKFLYRFADFARRNWIAVTRVSADEFLKFCYANPRFIIKPVVGSLGKGIRVIDINEVHDINALYSELNSGNYVAEEYLTACREIAEFNPDSLNTIRVVTYSNGKVFRVIGSFIRMGVKGSHIDNAHAGGVFAHVDVTTGTITTEGITTNGDRYVNHPTSGKKIPGFKIPLWDKVIETCRAAAAVMPEAKLIGWDVAIADDYRVVIIEGNHMPDFDVMQSPARKGVKKEFMSIVEDEYL